MMWEAVTALGTVFTGLVIVITAIIGIGQLRQFRAQRRDVAAVELVRSLQDDTFIEAYRVVFNVSQHDDPSDVSPRSEDGKAAIVLGFRFEMLGVLVNRRTIPFDIAEDLVGGLVLGSWLRLKDSTLKTRALLGWPGYLEWFQWLAEQFEKRQRLQQTPAHVRLKEWRPGGEAS